MDNDKSAKFFETYSVCLSSQLRRRWTIHMELAAGSDTQLWTIILVPAWSKNRIRLLELIFIS